jgi:hypothetical protein
MDGQFVSPHHRQRTIWGAQLMKKRSEKQKPELCVKGGWHWIGPSVGAIVGRNQRPNPKILGHVETIAAR